MKPRIFKFEAFTQRPWHIALPDGSCQVGGTWDDCVAWLTKHWTRVEKARLEVRR